MWRERDNIDAMYRLSDIHNMMRPVIEYGNPIA